MPYLFTSESVSEGHPDKLCDRVSDTVLDLFLAQEPEARVACETFATTNRVIIGGEVRASEDKMPGIMDSIESAVRGAIADIGYEQDEFHHAHLEFQNYLHKQSTDIAMGVDSGDNKDEGAGDQGLMFGYACRETDVLMPAAIHYSHQILKRLAEVRKADADTILGPDSKSQITLAYGDDGKPTGAHKVVLSTQHAEAATQSDIRKLVTPLIADVLPDGWMVGEEDLLPMAVPRRMAVAPSPARTRRRSTVRRPMPRVISPRMSSPPAWPSAAPYRSPMPSVLPSRYPSMPTRMAPAPSTMPASRLRSPNACR